MADIRRRAAGYSDPSLGVAFESLADVFAPPTGRDLYGYAHAAAERQKAQRMGDVWNMRDNPDQQMRDRAAIAAGLYNPNQGYYAVDTKDATDRRGQDITSGDRRYDTDVTARTSRANNADTNQTHVTTTLLTPIQKDAVRYIPQSVADMYSLPPQQTGVIAAQPGEKNYVPQPGGGYSTLEGNPKPKTESEVKGQIIADMTPEEQRAIGFGATPVDETATGPMTRPQRLASKTPSVDDKVHPQVFNSKNGPVRWDASKGVYVSVATGEQADVSGGLQAPSAVQDKAPLGSPTPANTTAAHARSAEDTTALNTLDLYETLVRKSPGSFGVVGAIRGTAQDAVASAQDFVSAFGDKAPQMKDAAQAVRAGLQGVAPELFDPAIPEADFMRGTLAYAIARTENPSGEVSRQAYSNAYARLGGGLLANQSSILAQIGAYRQVLNAKQSGTAVLQGAPPRTDTGYKGGAPAPAAGAPSRAEVEAEMRRRGLVQ